jgi:hypothetical protein
MSAVFSRCQGPESSGKKMKSSRCSTWMCIALRVSLLGSTLFGQAAPESKATLPIITDWSQRHLIFSQPATPEQAERVEKDPRYWMQRQRSKLTTQEYVPDVVEEKQSHSPQPHADWSENMGSGASVGAGNFPAKYSLSLGSAKCGNATQPDFVVYSTGLQGQSPAGTGPADIVAYDNIYSGCSTFGTVPSVYWAYDTLGTVLTSPTFSLDGTQVLFVQTNTTSGAGELVLLKWAASTTETVTSPGAPTRVGASTYVSCTSLPCMTAFTLTTSLGAPNNDTTSSAFYDYVNDVAWVGDAAGYLHKFTPVFNGTVGTPPKEIVTGGWPKLVNSGTEALSDPVFDLGSGNVFVGDLGGFLYRVNSSTAAVTASAQLDFGVGIVEGPIVDSNAGLVYVFASSDGSGACAGGVNCARIYQLTTTFAAGTSGKKVKAGVSTATGTTPNPFYIGAFDSTYENSTTVTGNLYVCGDTGGKPTLYQIPINAGTMAAAVTGPVLTSATTACSPVTDILNPHASGGATELLFAGVQASGTSTACAGGGCLVNFTDTPWKASVSYAVGQEILDSNLDIQVVSVAGTSGTAAPTWSKVIGATTTDGTVHWLDQGALSATTLAAWKANHSYALNTRILDSNGNVELVTTAGKSGASTPTWSTIAGVVTSDGTVTWTNLGAVATHALASAGGASGTVIDNTVGSGTLAGASQVYFSTLGNQTCGTTGTGGCAVQASQSALQ